MKKELLNEIVLGSAPAHIFSVVERAKTNESIRKTRNSFFFKTKRYIVYPFHKSPL